MSRIVHLVVFCAALAAAGCRSCRVQAAREIAPRDAWRVVALPLDDEAAPCLAADYSVHGYTGAQGSGILVARQLSGAFAAHARFRAVPDADARRAMTEAKLSLRDVATGDDEQACRLGRELGADMVVRGCVRAFATTWWLFVPRSEVRLELRGLDSITGRTLWTADARDVSRVRSGKRIAAGLSAGVVGEIAPLLPANAR